MGMKKEQRRGDETGGLNINSMMDMMTIILCFLLKSFEASDVTVQASDDLQIPASSALTEIKKAVQLVVTKRDIIVDGKLVVQLEQVQDDNGKVVSQVPDDEKKGELISELYDILQDKAEEAKQIEAAVGTEESKFKGQILLQCDRTLPFSLIRQVMYTAGQAQFGAFRFVVVKTSG